MVDWVILSKPMILFSEDAENWWLGSESTKKSTTPCRFGLLWFDVNELMVKFLSSSANRSGLMWVFCGCERGCNVGGDLWNVYEESVVNGLTFRLLSELLCFLLCWQDLHPKVLWKNCVNHIWNPALFGFFKEADREIDRSGNCDGLFPFNKKFAWLGDDSSCNLLCDESAAKDSREDLRAFVF